MLEQQKIINNRYSDQCQYALDVEIELFLISFKKEYEIMRIGREICMISKKKDKSAPLYLRGDNLMTKKQMCRKILSTKEYLNRKITNYEYIYAFVLMPHIKNGVRCQLNSKRATVREYSDNPFVFYRVLEKMYKNDFRTEKTDMDGVEEYIVGNKNFWQIFGKAEEGFQKYLDCFCLRCIKEIKNNEKYDKKYDIFFEKNIACGDEQDWKDYNSLMDLFAELRKLEVEKRIEYIRQLN